ncbi:hypothetical protein Q5P01_021491 [Channa striata]|uniref:SPRY-associated domain-containing protein n=1 Tax=Channa striata TaxID=64152 RepID=A0AA88RYY2_CHASR|nr:hypothetical protein Q5P01_021491 [Channa striata]
MDEHKHHDLVPAGTERSEKQKQLSTTLHKSQQRIDQRIKKWQDLRQAVESVKHSAQSVLEENERIFTELLLSIERKYNDVKEMIRTHEKATVSRAEILLNRLEEEITLLKKRHNDLEKLSHTDDHIHFLQSWQSLSGPSGYEDLNNISVAPYYSFETTKRAIAALKLQVEEVSKTEMSKISGAVKEVYITQEGETKTRRESVLREESKIRDEPRTRDDFLKYACQLVLDVNSVHPNLYLSEGNRTVTMKSERKNYPDHPDRFDHWQQVLCRDSVTGTRSYWEPLWTLWFDGKQPRYSRLKVTHRVSAGSGGAESNSWIPRSVSWRRVAKRAPPEKRKRVRSLSAKTEEKKPHLYQRRSITSPARWNSSGQDRSGFSKSPKKTSQTWRRTQALKVKGHVCPASVPSTSLCLQQHDYMQMSGPLS